MADIIEVNQQHVDSVPVLAVGDRVGFQDLSLDEHEDDPAKKACPTGGCPPDTKLNKDIYNDSIQQVAKTNSLDLNNPGQRKIAHMLVLPLFRRRNRENNKYKKQDTEGPSFAPGPDFEVRKEGIYFTNFKKSFRQMRADQKRLRPDLVDPQTEKTLDLMESAFANGATRVRHVSHNKDAQGNYAIRDEITMIVDPVTGKGKMEIRNIGNDISMKEAYDVMNKTQDGFIEGHPTEGIFIFTDAPIEPKVVHKILDEAKELPREVQENIRYAVEPIAEGLSHVAEFVEERALRKIDGWLKRIEDTYIGDVRIPRYLQKLLGVPQPVLGSELMISTEEYPLILTETPEHITEEATLIRIWKTLAEKTLGITPKQSERLLEQLYETSEKFHDAKDMLAFIVKADVSVGAGLLVLRILTLQEEPDEKVFFISEFVASSKPNLETGSLELVTQLTQVEKDLIFSSENYAIDFQKLLPDGIDVDVLVRTMGFVRVIDILPQEEKETVIIKEKEKTLREIVLLWDSLKEISHHEGVSAVLHSPRELISAEEIRITKEKDEVRDFSLALVIWMLLKVSGYYANLEFLHSVVVKKEKISTVQLIQKEPVPWLLLSIIWHLAMIREQGMTQTQPQPIKRSKKKYFPQHGIIFAFSS